MSEKLTPYQQWKKNLGTTRPWDMLNPNTQYATEEEAEKRMDICKQCPFLIKATNQCKKCGCIMHLKTKLAGAECPVGNW
jgi:hypothetical protein